MSAEQHHASGTQSRAELRHQLDELRRDIRAVQGKLKSLRKRLHKSVKVD